MAITDPTDISDLNFWVVSNYGLFQNTSGTTPATSNGHVVARWDDYRNNGNYLRNDLAPSFGATLVENGYSSGTPAVRFDNGFLKMDGVGSFDFNEASVFVVHRRRSYSNIPVVNAFPTSGSLVADLLLHDGRQRPGSGNVGSGPEAEIGSPFNQWAVTGLVTSPSGGSHFAVNDRVSSDLGAFSSIAEQGIGLGTCQGVIANFDLVEMVFYERTLSPTESADVMSYLMGKYSIQTPSRKWNLVFDGNSITEGSNATYRPFADIAAVNVGVSEYDYLNYGWSGVQTDALATRAATLAPSVYQTSLGPRNIAVCWEGTNQLGANVDPATVMIDIENHCLEWRAAGYRVVTGTLMDRNGLFTNGQDQQEFQSDISVVNDWLRNNWWQFADALAEINLDENLGPDGAASNSTYFADGVHPTSAGHSLIAQHFAEALSEAMIGDGSVKAGGSAHCSVVRTASATGGATLSGTSLNFPVFVPPLSGGTACDGTAIHTLNALERCMGGVSVAGTSAVNAIISSSVSSSGGVLSGLSLIQMRSLNLTSGGCAAGGSSGNSLSVQTATTGGCQVGGAAIGAIDLNSAISGGIVLAGVSAHTMLIAATGIPYGGFVSGSGLAGIRWSTSGNGGVACSGEAGNTTVGRIGGVRLAGRAIVTRRPGVKLPPQVAANGHLCNTAFGYLPITWTLVRSKQSRGVAYVPAITVCNRQLYLRR